MQLITTNVKSRTELEVRLPARFFNNAGKVHLIVRNPAPLDTPQVLDFVARQAHNQRWSAALVALSDALTPSPLPRRTSVIIGDSRRCSSAG